jgi:hypothetical protein
MFQSHVIEVTGRFAGVAVTAAGRFRFVAIDPRLSDLDGSEWPSLADVRRVVTGVLAQHLGPARQDGGASA